MVLVIGALILGFITAQLGTFTAEQRSIMDKISTASLMLLLFFHGPIAGFQSGTFGCPTGPGGVKILSISSGNLSGQCGFNVAVRAGGEVVRQ